VQLVALATSDLVDPGHIAVHRLPLATARERRWGRIPDGPRRGDDIERRRPKADRDDARSPSRSLEKQTGRCDVASHRALQRGAVLPVRLGGWPLAVAEDDLRH
jgi:hypothetical protein